LHFFERRDQVALGFAFGFRGVADVAGEINGFADARLAGRDVALEFREEVAGDVAFGQQRGVVRFGGRYGNELALSRASWSFWLMMPRVALGFSGWGCGVGVGSGMFIYLCFQANSLIAVAA